MELTTVFAVISAITTVLSIIFAILAFARNRGIDSKTMEARLTSMEKDILYIRQNLDDTKEWHYQVEKRLYTLESKVK